MTSKNKVRYCACLVATVDLLGLLLGAPIRGADAQVTIRTTAAPQSSSGASGARAPLSPEQTAALLAAIPDDHPRRDELRQVIREGPPDGFTAEEWLRLAMKFNFRMPGAARLRNAGGD